jgi:hypothetical protein
MLHADDATKRVIGDYIHSYMILVLCGLYLFCWGLHCYILLTHLLYFIMGTIFLCNLCYVVIYLFIFCFLVISVAYNSLMSG